VDLYASLAPAWAEPIEAVCAGEAAVRPVFQPIVDVGTGAVAGYEALARFEPDNGAGPAEWFDAAARLGYGGRLEAKVLEVQLEARRSLPPNTFLSVNIRPDSLESDEVATVLHRERDLRALVVELTEQAAVADYDRLRDDLRSLRARGAHVAVDDAGSGYSSLRHILALEPQFVKLDRALVSNLHANPRKLAAVRALGALAAALDAWVVAEGVEEVEELDALLAIEVPLVQGYLLGRPAPELEPLRSDMAERLARSPRSRAGLGTGQLVERAATVGPGQAGDLSPEHVQGLLDAEVVVELDEFKRPVSLIVSAGAAPPRRRQVLRVGAREPIGAVAQRAMARPPASRFLPVALCDERGGLIGLIRIERLVDALARGD
jgi:EAL domain-containing protein (putative c-di-GMP-specific phosphodiesterase class I)